MRAPYKHNQRITAVIAAAGAVALITGSIVLGLAGEDAAAEPDATQNQQIEAPAPLMVCSALTRTAEDGGGDRSQSVEALEKLLPRLNEQSYGLSFPKAPEAG
ncbi:hypothetical protein ACE1OC_28970 [Streptomyces sp. DSM 116496]|uniref:hypothetical protein n=1 Tax=Streptomyces stoeckheimensis TaxID=3344656 RepID=UPI0038B318C7